MGFDQSRPRRIRRGDVPKKRLWLDEWAFAVVELGAPCPDYWTLTHNQFTALHEAWKTKMIRDGHRLKPTPAEEAATERANQRAMAAHFAIMAADTKRQREADGQGGSRHG